MAEQQTLKVKCNNCGRNIVIGWHTTQCPKCGIALESGEVQGLLSQYQDNLNNSKIYQAGVKMEKTGESMKEIGNGLSSCGCFLTIFVTIPILIILFLLMF